MHERKHKKKDAYQKGGSNKKKQMKDQKPKKRCRSLYDLKNKDFTVTFIEQWDSNLTAVFNGKNKVSCMFI